MSGGSTISGGGGANNNNNNKKKSPGSGFPLSSQVPVSTLLPPSVSAWLLQVFKTCSFRERKKNTQGLHNIIVEYSNGDIDLHLSPISSTLFLLFSPSSQCPHHSVRSGISDSKIYMRLYYEAGKPIWL